MVKQFHQGEKKILPSRPTQYCRNILQILFRTCDKDCYILYGIINSYRGEKIRR